MGELQAILSGHTPVSSLARFLANLARSLNRLLGGDPAARSSMQLCACPDWVPRGDNRILSIRARLLACRSGSCPIISVFI